jgi:hypothetical protein
MTFKTISLDGIEPALKHGAPPTNPFKDSDWRKVDATHWARKS